MASSRSKTLAFTQPGCDISTESHQARFTLTGAWIAPYAPALEEHASSILSTCEKSKDFAIDLQGIERLDTLGALVLDHTAQDLKSKGVTVSFENARTEHQLLLDQVAEDRGTEPVKPPHPAMGMKLLADIGQGVVGVGRDFAGGTSFLGEVVTALTQLSVHPRRFRGAAFVHHLEQIAFQGVPIIALISFLVGGIVAQQGIFQLQTFGATPFVVNLVGILILRELGVLLTSIMVAGRSGSAFTAEMGSMKMREEVDALRVMGLDPIEVLVVPRILALIVGLPMLTFLADLSALLGGWLIASIYGGVSTDVFLSRLQSAIGLNTFLVGLIKAPFMALVIGLIASMEGMAVKGSAESLGRQVTASVVKSIFMVIVVDGFFAIFFAAIKY